MTAGIRKWLANELCLRRKEEASYGEWSELRYGRKNML